MALTEEVKREAYLLSQNAHANVFDILCRIYGLDRVGNEFLVGHIKDMLARHQYKEVSLIRFAKNVGWC